jgi:hypothetical protein
MSKPESPERRWAATWQSGLEHYGPPMLDEMRSVIRTLPGIRPEAAEHVLDRLAWLPPSRTIVAVVMHNGCEERAAEAYNAAYDRLAQRAGEQEGGEQEPWT